MFRPSQDALVAKRVGGIEAGLHAHERYLTEHGVPRSMDELSGHAIIGFDEENAFIRKLQDRFPAFSRLASVRSSVSSCSGTKSWLSGEFGIDTS